METDFLTRLEALRSAAAKSGSALDTQYVNGAAPADDNITAWDNFDRYYKFYN